MGKHKIQCWMMNEQEIFLWAECVLLNYFKKSALILSAWTLPWCPCTCELPSPVAVLLSGLHSSASLISAETEPWRRLWTGYASWKAKSKFKNPVKASDSLNVLSERCLILFPYMIIIAQSCCNSTCVSHLQDR